MVRDLEFAQRRTPARAQAADRSEAVAAALRRGGAGVRPGTLTVRVPDEVRADVEVELEDGEAEPGIELSWPTGPPTERASGAATDPPLPGRGAPAWGAAQEAVVFSGSRSESGQT
ncbi:hypothetical protein GCM10020256_73690 [Streptomyces thermocoprophilus]